LPGFSMRKVLVQIAAKRLSKEEVAAGEWAAILSLEDKEEPPEEGITVADLNKICNKGLKLMLNEDMYGLADFQGELNLMGKTFSESKEKDGALFIYVLWKMSDHVIVDQTTSLSGMYLEAFRRVFDILEDSGWQLVREGEEEELNSLADLPDLPYMKQV